MSLPLLAVVNPASAGGRTYERWPPIASLLLRHGLDYEAHCTTGPGDATATVRAALRQGTTRCVVAVGGDGTLNEVVDGFFGDDGTVIDANASLALIPSGTGGDFRRSAGIPADAAAAVALLASGATRAVDCGRIEFAGGTRRHFVNIADCGLGGEVVARVNRSRHKGGGLTGSAVFFGVSLRALVTFGSRRVRVTCDGETADHDVQSVVVANGQYFGGGMHIAPRAQLDDGAFDVVVVHARGRVRSLRGLPSLYRGTHLTQPGVTLRRARSVHIEPLDGVALFDVEGEQVGRAPATITCVPRALTLHAQRGQALAGRP